MLINNRSLMLFIAGGCAIATICGLLLYFVGNPFKRSPHEINGQKPLVIIIPSYNNEKYCERNLESVFSQQYDNYRVIYVDDCSTDRTYELVKKHVDSGNQKHRVTIIHNKNRCGALANLYKAIHSCNDQEIVVCLDGDDWFAGPSALARVNQEYAESTTWMTYGQFIVHPTNQLGFCQPLPNFIIDTNAMRKFKWVSSHLRTFYAWLFKKIKIEDLKYNNDFFPVTWDLAFMFPMLEMAGHHAHCISDILYVYNQETPLNDFKQRLEEVLRMENIIRNMPPYARLDVNDQIRTDLVDFDSSMEAWRGLTVQGPQQAPQLFAFFRALYIKNHMAYLPAQETPKIPKIIHQIWFGGKLPEPFVPLHQSWIDHHPSWKFIFWTDNPQNYNLGTVVAHTFQEVEHYLQDPSKQFIVVDVKKLTFDNRKFFDLALNYAEKSDILRWEVVNRFGGTYIDTDFECFKPLDELHHKYDFYTGIQPLDTAYLQLGAAIFGAIPGHPIMKHCVDTIKNDHAEVKIIFKTGPIHFTKSFAAMADLGKEIDIALPASYFYPCPYGQKGSPSSSWQKPESYAVHLWAESWLKPEATITAKAQTKKASITA